MWIWADERGNGKRGAGADDFRAERARTGELSLRSFAAPCIEIAESDS